MACRAIFDRTAGAARQQSLERQALPEQYRSES
jgi:hypothetical protein